MKKYIKARKYRQIPVGYSAADIVANRQLAAEYFNCGDEADARIDMFGVNDYSWCGESSFVVSGYSTKMKLYQDYSVPVFLSEFGCNQVKSSRPFTEIEAIYSTQMSSVFSGGLVYEYSNETNNYGLVQIDGDKVTKLTDFENLKMNTAKYPTQKAMVVTVLPTTILHVLIMKRVSGKLITLCLLCQVLLLLTSHLEQVLLWEPESPPNKVVMLRTMTTKKTTTPPLHPLLPLHLHLPLLHLLNHHPRLQRHLPPPLLLAKRAC